MILKLNFQIYSWKVFSAIIKKRVFLSTSLFAYFMSILVRPEGFEPPAFGSVDQRSIQLSYERILNIKIILQPVTLLHKLRKLLQAPIRSSKFQNYNKYTILHFDVTYYNTIVSFLQVKIKILY